MVGRAHSWSPCLRPPRFPQKTVRLAASNGKTEQETIHGESESAETTHAKLNQKISDVRVIRTRMKISTFKMFEERRSKNSGEGEKKDYKNDR